jgi:rhodanese-related sulfurtransferase
MARKMIRNGYTDVAALVGGWREWQRAKYPVVEK